MIRIGKCHYKNGKRIDPTFDGFLPIVCLTKSSKWGSLGPYVLTNEKGQIMENIWQFSKVYKNIPKSIQYYSKWNKTIIWNHPEEKHITENGELTNEYFNWRIKGMNNKFPVRYPVGFKQRHKCLYSLKDVDGSPLDYINSRKEIYLSIYCKLVKEQSQYKILQTFLEKGFNLLIIEVDGPHQESMNYYMNTYGVKSDFIENNTILATTENLKLLLNDSKHPFGHGYCLAASLLNLNIIE